MEDKIKLKDSFLREVGMLSRAIHTAYDLKFRGLLLQKGQFIFLTRICEREGLCMKELSEILRADKTTVSKAVQKLIEAGYVTKVQDEKDRREYRLYPSQKAKDIYPMIIGAENRSLDICFQGLSEEEIKLANKLLRKMNQNYEKEWKQRKNGGKKDDTSCQGK